MKQTKQIENHYSRISWTSESKHVFPKRSAVIIEGTEKPKIPSKFAKHTVRYNEFHCKITLKKIEKSILRCRKTINSLKNYFSEKQLCKEWSAHAIAHTPRADDSNNNKTHVFSLLSVNKFKSFLLNLPYKTHGNRISVHCWVMDVHGRRLGRIAKHIM